MAGPEPDGSRPSAWIGETLAALRRLGGRATPQRRRILEAIDAAPAGASAEELVTVVSGSAGRAARSTVYRTLDTLREIGAVDIVHPRPEHHRYIPRRTADQHHVVCEACGRVALVQDCEFQRTVEAIETETRYTVRRHTLEIFGTCEECRQASG